MATGRFITFEGGEGAGKSTQIRLLHQTLTAWGQECVLTREPGGAPGAEAIRALLVHGEPDRWDGITEALLHNAARRDHLVKTVWPAMERGGWVLCDRFMDSTLAYQGYGHGLDRQWISQLAQLTMGDFRPDLTIILDLPTDCGLERASHRGGAEDRYERMGIDFHQRLRQGFRDIAAAEPQRCVLVDAVGSVEQVQERIWQAVSERLGLTVTERKP